MTRIITQSHEHAQAHSYTQSWPIPPPSPEHARPSSRTSSFSNMTTNSRSRTSSPDVYSSVRFASSHHTLHQNGAGMHTTILNALRRSRSHAQLIGDTDPEAPTYIDPSELYEPPPLPKLEDEEMVDEVQDQRRGFHWKMAQVQLKVDIAVHRAKKAMKRKVGLK